MSNHEEKNAKNIFPLEKADLVLDLSEPSVQLRAEEEVPDEEQLEVGGLGHAALPNQGGLSRD